MLRGLGEIQACWNCGALKELGAGMFENCRRCLSLAATSSKLAIACSARVEYVKSTAVRQA